MQIITPYSSRELEVFSSRINEAVEKSAIVHLSAKL